MPSVTGRDQAARYAVITDDGWTEAASDPIRLLRRTLRGRYPLVIALAVALGAIGAVSGFHGAAPTYESTGLLRVESTLPSVLYDTRENGAPPNFDAFVAAQATLIESRQVLDAAVMDESLRAAGWPEGLAGLALLQESLSVERRRGEQVITLSVAHRDPALAQEAVNAVIRAFEAHLASVAAPSPQTAVQTLRARERGLEEEIQALREEQLTTSGQYGPDAIDRMHANKVQELIGLDQKLAELSLAMAADAPATPMTMTPVVDPLADLREQKQALEAERASYRHRYGPRHPIMQELSRRIEALDIRMQLRAQAIDTSLAAGGSDGPDAIAAGRPENDLPTLYAQYTAMRERVQEDAAALGRQKTQLAGLAVKLVERGQMLKQTRQRLDQLEVEGPPATAQRVQVAAWGGRPLVPTTDRRPGLATAGFVMGGAVAVAVVFLIGLIDPRCRYVDELAALDPASAVVGCLPDLAGRNGQGHPSAALAVHQLRNLLEMREYDGSGSTYTITSATRGEGKTSLALALATSFALAGRRTLIIDTDVVRAGLTRELNLVGRRGLWQGIDPASSGGEIHSTMRLNLWAMPVGEAGGSESTDLSIDKLRWLVQAVRDQFDTVIIDTGSLLNSLEAALVSGASDHVLLVVARHRGTRQVRAALRVLEQIDARCAGLVFNRATASDVVQNEKLVARQQTAAASLVVPVEASTTAGGMSAAGPGVAVAARIGPHAPEPDREMKQAA